jgi:hypothetical protein
MHDHRYLNQQKYGLDRHGLPTDLVQENERLKAEIAALRAENEALRKGSTALVKQEPTAPVKRLAPRGDLVQQAIVKQPRIPINTYSTKEIAAYLGIDEKRLSGITPYPYTGILYPFAMICVFHLVIYRKTFIPRAEAICDELLQEFIQMKTAEVGADRYFKTYREATSLSTQRLTMLRILLATFEFGYKKIDNLPSTHRTTACDFLNLPYDIKLSEVQTMLEEEQLKYNIEERILGRVGFLIIWKELAGPDYNFTAPNTDKVEAVVEPDRPIPPEALKTGVAIVRQHTARDARGLPLDRSALKEWGREDTEQDIVEGPIPGIDDKQDSKDDGTDEDEA